MNIFQQVFANVGQPTENQHATLSTSESTQALPKTKKLENIQTNSVNPQNKRISNQKSTPILTVNFDLSNIQAHSKIDSIKENSNSTIQSRNQEKALLDRLASIQKKVSEIELKLKHEEQELRNIRENNDKLKNEKHEKEIRIEKLNAASNETNRKIIEMQDEFDRKEDELNRHWQFKFMELRFQIDVLKEEPTA